MKKSNNNKISLTIKVIISVGTALVLFFSIFLLMFYWIEKTNLIPAKEIVKEEDIQVNKQSIHNNDEKTQLKPESPNGRSTGKVVYLTFDDGPSKLTDQFLDILKEQNIKATFFMQGTNLKNRSYQESVKRAVKEGHYIGAHSMTHDNSRLYKYGQFVSEMKETLALIHDITGESPKLVRPPFGSKPGLNSVEIRNQIAQSGIKIWDWTIDSYDWKLKDNPRQIIENVKNQTTKDVEVILMHEKLQTLRVLPDIIKFFREKGYEFEVYRDSDHFSLNFQKDQRL